MLFEGCDLDVSADTSGHTPTASTGCSWNPGFGDAQIAETKSRDGQAGSLTFSAKPQPALALKREDWLGYFHGKS